MSFSALLSEAKSEAAADTKATANLPRGGMIAGVLAYLEMLDDEGLPELATFQEECLPAFREFRREEHSLEHTQMHDRFCALFEKRIESFVRHNGWTIDDFYKKVRKELAGIPANSQESEGKEGDDAAELLKYVREASDFPTWAEGMRISAQLKYWADDDDDAGGEMPSHTRGFINLPAEQREYLDS